MIQDDTLMFVFNKVNGTLPKKFRTEIERNAAGEPLCVNVLNEEGGLCWTATVNELVIEAIYLLMTGGRRGGL